MLILCVVAGLAMLCCIFPSDGINLGFTQLSFPGLIEALRGDTTALIDPEAMMAQLEREQQVAENAQRDSAFIASFSKSPARIWFPDDDPSYFDPVFAALDNAHTRHTRIIHYGDSQIELDRISCDLREKLQERFGGHGKGWIPAVALAGNYTVSTTCSPRLRQGMQYSASPETRPRDKKGGPYATAAYLDGGSVTINARASGEKKYPHVFGFNRVKVVTGNCGELKVTCGDTTANVPASEGITVATLDIDTTSNARVTISGRAHIYGVLLESGTGVSIDNVPMRGCTGTIFTSLDTGGLAQFFKDENVPLIIMQFGGNVVPGIGPRNVEPVIKMLRNQIEFFKTIAPHTRILFIGPSDMATQRGGGLHTYKNLPMFIDHLKLMCNDAGIAYWDMYAVMGGNDSMVSWNKKGLAGSDYIHFTTRGAERIAGILHNTLMLYHDYYTFRKKAHADARALEQAETDTKTEKE